ncbi:MAG TPA: two-component regulator propeller domain-containing protein [Bryobacteraceae bacterium]|nr:two-component regulator propeller domain-containing protein [Bryobacteraceae bacterium]
MNPRFALIVLAAVSLRPALGLDPNRTLTQYYHRIWQAQQGLPEGTIYTILQTHEGYLWLGTQGGLIRFDGVRFDKFENIRRTPSANAWIRGAVEDSRHALWLSTADSGLLRVDGDTVQRFLPSENVQCLAKSRNGDIWACAAQGIARVTADGKLTIYSTVEGLASKNTRAVCEGGDGTIWVASDNKSLNAWDGARFIPRKLQKLPADGTIRAMECSGDGVWVGSAEGLLHVTPSGERLFTVKDGLADTRVLCLSRGRDGSLWVGTRNGFSRMRNGEIESYRPEEGLSQSTVYSIVEDAEGSLWVGTKNGLNQFLSGRALPYTAKEGLPSNETGPILQDKAGTIWIGMLGAGLSRFDGRKFATLTTAQGLASNTVYALAEDHQGALWAGTTAGIDMLREGRIARHYATGQGLPAASVRALFIDHKGTLWVGTEKGPASLRDGAFSVPAGIPPELRGTIAAIGEDREGRILFALEHASLYIYENGAARELLDNGAPVRDVDAIYLDPDGGIWIGTQGFGLKLLDRGRITTFLIRDGMFDNEIYGVMLDRKDRLWMACSKGLFSVRRSDLVKFANGGLKKLLSTTYSPMDALRTIECRSGVQPGSIHTSDGRLWFSTIRGLYVFDPNHLTLNIPAPPVVIEETTVNGEPVAPQAIGAIPPGLKNLEFTYTGLTFVQPNRVKFRYMLEGFDKNWIDAGTRREAFYTNLPPAKYRFRVTACNADAVCNEAGAEVAFSLAPHFYQQPWFAVLCVLGLALAGWSIYQMRIHRLREQFNIILTERSRIARELHDTLIQGLSGITMEMQALAARLRSPEERAKLEEIVRDAGTCLRETRRSVAGLRSARGPGSGLAAAIAEAAKHITEAKAVRLRLRLGKSPADLSPEVQYNLLRIASEAMNNSVKHSGAKSIEVAMESTAEQLKLSVRDDGSGFSRENGNVGPGHYGLIGMRERAAQIGAELEVDTEPGRGTTITVLLPAGSRQTAGVHIS